MKPSSILILAFVIIFIANFAINHPIDTLHIILGLTGLIVAGIIFVNFFEYIRALAIGLLLSYSVVFGAQVFEKALSPDKHSLPLVTEKAISNLLISFFPHSPGIRLITNNFWDISVALMTFPTVFYVYRYYKQLEREGRYF
ncbi:hypothetical protein [Thermoanaerobacter mathranii]|uniref:hypothetical protein n=1 Tax=Thermoanaerobacter mathranii TaxID=583357 RepID=UPI003D6B3621